MDVEQFWKPSLAGSLLVFGYWERSISDPGALSNNVQTCRVMESLVEDDHHLTQRHFHEYLMLRSDLGQ